ncbi:MAG: hypothetical protein KJ732_04720, partial [Candidatus Margulisbacteria bacterium]|nr:hypothetical protein [Candidatus Margulisiibacteriota bacterium]
GVDQSENSGDPVIVGTITLVDENDGLGPTSNITIGERTAAQTLNQRDHVSNELVRVLEAIPGNATRAQKAANASTGYTNYNSAFANVGDLWDAEALAAYKHEHGITIEQLVTLGSENLTGNALIRRYLVLQGLDPSQFESGTDEAPGRAQGLDDLEELIGTDGNIPANVTVEQIQANAAYTAYTASGYDRNLLTTENRALIQRAVSAVDDLTPHPQAPGAAPFEPIGFVEALAARGISFTATNAIELIDFDLDSDGDINWAEMQAFVTAWNESHADQQIEVTEQFFNIIANNVNVAGHENSDGKISADDLARLSQVMTAYANRYGVTVQQAFANYFDPETPWHDENFNVDINGQLAQGLEGADLRDEAHLRAALQQAGYNQDVIDAIITMIGSTTDCSTLNAQIIAQYLMRVAKAGELGGEFNGAPYINRAFTPGASFSAENVIAYLQGRPVLEDRSLSDYDDYDLMSHRGRFEDQYPTALAQSQFADAFINKLVAEGRYELAREAWDIFANPSHEDYVQGLEDTQPVELRVATHLLYDTDQNLEIRRDGRGSARVRSNITTDEWNTIYSNLGNVVDGQYPAPHKTTALNQLIAAHRERFRRAEGTGDQAIMTTEAQAIEGLLIVNTGNEDTPVLELNPDALELLGEEGMTAQLRLLAESYTQLHDADFRRHALAVAGLIYDDWQVTVPRQQDGQTVEIPIPKGQYIIELTSRIEMDPRLREIVQAISVQPTDQDPDQYTSNAATLTQAINNLEGLIRTLEAQTNANDDAIQNNIQQAKMYLAFCQYRQGRSLLGTERHAHGMELINTAINTLGGDPSDNEDNGVLGWYATRVNNLRNDPATAGDSHITQYEDLRIQIIQQLYTSAEVLIDKKNDHGETQPHKREYQTAYQNIGSILRDHIPNAGADIVGSNTTLSHDKLREIGNNIRNGNVRNAQEVYRELGLRSTSAPQARSDRGSSGTPSEREDGPTPTPQDDS